MPPANLTPIPSSLPSGHKYPRLFAKDAFSAVRPHAVTKVAD